MDECGIIADYDSILEFINPQADINEKRKNTFYEESFKKWKYHLHLGREVYISTDDLPKHLKKGEYFVIKPGDFVLLLTSEVIRLPDDVMGFISMRFDYKYKGLINVSGFHVDPGYHGKLIFSAFNAGPRDIVLHENEGVFMIFFQKIPQCSSYNSKDMLGKKKIEKPEFEKIPSDMIESIRGKSVTLSSNATRLEKLEFYVKVLGGITTAAFLGLLMKMFQPYMG